MFLSEKQTSACFCVEFDVYFEGRIEILWVFFVL
uniref:Uncharacterized protein n=1 Tax=Neisseria meningitidis alpha275 TaxID=295996 RepID=C6SLY4_NEIME|nr:hypothetical protein predicted by Glimmer/Critica [Neisseria meningitidis alpha275]